MAQVLSSKSVPNPNQELPTRTQVLPNPPIPISVMAFPTSSGKGSSKTQRESGPSGKGYGIKADIGKSKTNLYSHVFNDSRPLRQNHHQVIWRGGWRAARRSIKPIPASMAKFFHMPTTKLFLNKRLAHPWARSGRDSLHSG